MLILHAPAKINLFLEILKKRKDGYHNIHTLFLKINLFDKLCFRKTNKGIRISSTGYPVPTDDTNLSYVATKLLLKAKGVNRGVHIHIVKKIPVAAGLGGGSSDAASTLLGLNKLWKLGLTDRELFSLGRKIGADVPFFLLPDAAALGAGKGDKLRPVSLLRKFWIILVKPELSIFTKEVYRALPENLTKRKFDVKLLIHALRSGNIEAISKNLFNRLEAVTFKKFKYLAEVKKMISALGVRAVLMSGSGSVIFGILENREEAMHIRSKLQRVHEVMVVKSL